MDIKNAPQIWQVFVRCKAQSGIRLSPRCLLKHDGGVFNSLFIAFVRWAKLFSITANSRHHCEQLVSRGGIAAVMFKVCLLDGSLARGALFRRPYLSFPSLASKSISTIGRNGGIEGFF